MRILPRGTPGSLLVGGFEPVARPIRLDAIPEDFCFDELPGHMEDKLMPVLADAMDRVPLLREVGWRSFFCGPESFTHDDQFHVGESPELGNFYVACGLNSVGIVTSGGIGKVCAEWMDKGHPPLDLTSNDLRRTFVFQGTQAYIEDRVSETLGLLYDRHYPYRQYASARDVRHSPVHERLAARGACFGEAAGWERPNWFAPEGGRAPLRVQLRPPELVRAFRRRAPRGARGRRPVRPVELLEVPRQGPRRLPRAATHLQQTTSMSSPDGSCTRTG